MNMDVHDGTSPTYQGMYSTRSPNEIRTRIIIDSQAPLLMKIPVAFGNQLTLGQFKTLASLYDDHYKFYFKSQDSEFGTVKEELVDEESILPVEDGQITVWVISNEQIQSSLFESDQQPGEAWIPPDQGVSRIYDYRPRDDFDSTGSRRNPQSHKSTSQSTIGFDPATELPAPVIDITSPISMTERALPRVHDHHATAYSLPRSLTPRSLYTTGNFDTMTSSADFQFPLDSKSMYEPTTPNSTRQIGVPLHCGKDDIYAIHSVLKSDSASLDIRDRDWLKVIVKDAFLGSTLVKWLSRNVYGFCNRSEVKRYANQMLSLGLIKCPMSNSSFSEKCYYTL